MLPAVGAAALGNLIFMVGKDQIDPAAVEIDFRGRPITWGSISELVDEIEGLLRKGGVAPGA